jgi:hypothetical protein
MDDVGAGASTYTDVYPVFNSSNYYRVHAVTDNIDSQPTASTPAAFALTAPTGFDDANAGPNSRGSLAPFSILHDHIVVLDQAQLLVNDIEWAGLTNQLVSHTSPQLGSLTDNPNGSITYTPNAHWTGTDTFTYTSTNAHGISVATGSIRLWAVWFSKTTAIPEAC